MISEALSVVAFAWSLGLASTAAWAAFRSAPPRRRRRARTDDAILIRPCAGHELSLTRALGSTVHARGAARLHVCFAVASVDDGAFPVAEAVAAELRGQGLDARTVVTGAAAPNRKVDQLARTLARGARRASIVIVADSDVDMRGIQLDQLAGPLSDARTAAVWAAPVETEPRTLADRASAAVLDGSLHAFPVLASLDAGGMVGKLFAIKRDALEDIGGFGALVGHLGEDMEIARRLRARGWRVQIAPFVASSLAQGRSWGDVVQRYGRWITVIRGQRPHLLWTYPGVIVATPLVILLSLAAMALGMRSALVAAAVAAVTRAFVGGLARIRSGRPLTLPSLPVDIVLADLLLTAAFARALCSRRTVWRGVELRVNARDGTVTAEAR